MQENRKDTLMAQKVETALVFRRMVGRADAEFYLRAERVPDETIERVLGGDGRADDKPPAAPAPATEPAAQPEQRPFDRHFFYLSAGRRRDMVRAAIVQAAIRIAGELGRGRAVRLLQREGLGDDVVERVLCDEAGRDRRRPIDIDRADSDRAV